MSPVEISSITTLYVEAVTRGDTVNAHHLRARLEREGLPVPEVTPDHAPSGFCRRCWDEAATRAHGRSDTTQTDEYARLIAETRPDRQPCGHPLSAIVSDPHEGTSYCSDCEVIAMLGSPQSHVMEAGRELAPQENMENHDAKAEVSIPSAVARPVLALDQSGFGGGNGGPRAVPGEASVPEGHPGGRDSAVRTSHAAAGDRVSRVEDQREAREVEDHTVPRLHRTGGPGLDGLPQQSDASSAETVRGTTQSTSAPNGETPAPTYTARLTLTGGTPVPAARETVRLALPRIVNTGPVLPRIDPALVAAALGAEPVYLERPCPACGGDSQCDPTPGCKKCGGTGTIRRRKRSDAGRPRKRNTQAHYTEAASVHAGQASAEPPDGHGEQGSSPAVLPTAGANPAVSALARIVGKWPGDETEAELLEALQSTSPSSPVAQGVTQATGPAEVAGSPTTPATGATNGGSSVPQGGVPPTPMDGNLYTMVGLTADAVEASMRACDTVETAERSRSEAALIRHKAQQMWARDLSADERAWWARHGMRAAQAAVDARIQERQPRSACPRCGAHSAFRMGSMLLCDLCGLRTCEGRNTECGCEAHERSFSGVVPLSLPLSLKAGAGESLSSAPAGPSSEARDREDDRKQRDAERIARDLGREVIAWDANHRDEGIGASEAHLLLHDTMRLYCLKRGIVAPLEDTEFLEAGRYLEPGIAAWFAAKTGLRLRGDGRLVVRDAVHPWVFASPDRFVYEGDRLIGLLEIKNVGGYRSDDWGATDDYDLPAPYYLQLQWQLGVTGLTKAWICPLIGGNKLRTDHTIAFDPEVYAGLMAIARAFWLGNVQKGEAPALSASDSTAAYLRAKFPAPTSPDLAPAPEGAVALAELYLDAAEKIGPLERAQKEVKHQLQAMIGDAPGLRLAEDGWAVTWKARADGVRVFSLKRRKA